MCARYGFLVYNGSVHFWHASRPLQREGLHAQLLGPQQQVVDAVRKLPGKQEWLSRLLLQTALAQLEVLPYMLVQQLPAHLVCASNVAA